MPGKDTEERATRDMLEIFAFNAQIEQTYRWVASSYSTANILIVLTFVLVVMTGWPWFLLLLVPVAVIIFTTEVVVEDMHQQMLLYLERCGVDVSGAPKPLFPRLRAGLRRLRR
jgi:hypothetical protein